jgi:hypothetical protein
MGVDDGKRGRLRCPTTHPTLGRVAGALALSYYPAEAFQFSTQ